VSRNLEDPSSEQMENSECSFLFRRCKEFIIVWNGIIMNFFLIHYVQLGEFRVTKVLSLYLACVTKVPVNHDM
jgi:hypothetical protein